MTTEPGEAQLLLRARRGDFGAFRELADEHMTALFRTAYSITGSAEDAEEVLQDAMLKAFRACHRIRPDTPLRPWLITVVANAARNRRRAADGRLTVPLDEREPQSQASSAQDAVATRDRRLVVGAALRRLSDTDRDVVVCRFLLELSEAETASVLAVPAGTVKSRLSRALDRLRVELETLDVRA